jgi:hypothetical protein
MSNRLFVMCAATAAVLVGAGSANASVLIYKADLLGSNESPPNASPAVGSARVFIDDVANTMTVHIKFSGLIGTTTASHIHCCTAAPGTGTAGVATTTPTFPGFPLGVMSGSYSQTFDLTSASSWNAAFVTAQGSVPAAETALLGGLSADKAYLNIHSSFRPGGEIRGFLTPAPEPSSWVLMIGGLGLAGAALRGRRRSLSAAA